MLTYLYRLLSTVYRFFMRPVTILPATIDQAEILSEIAIAAKAYWGYPPDYLAIWKPLLTITPMFITQHLVYMAQVGTEIVGFYALISAPPPQIVLEHLWVKPSYIRQGVGQQLFVHAMRTAAEVGATAVEITADPHAEGFYHRMGAQRIGVMLSHLLGESRFLPLMLVNDLTFYGEADD
jgi:GNAT superfamily N-acetyltransferase